MEIYLDNSATTKVSPAALEASVEAMTQKYGNPSSVHSLGVRANRMLENARQSVAGVLGVGAEEIYFSHSGTLANNTAVFGAVNARRRYGNRIVTTAVEHPSVARCMDKLESDGFEVIRLMPGENGAFNPSDLLSAVNSKTVLVSTMLVNNETGAVNPVELISRAVARANAPALIHIDAIQGFGKMPVSPKRLGADLLTVSGHKVHAPKGVGALYIKKGIQIKPFVLGGGQENNLFSGTQALPAIAGFGAACREFTDINERLAYITRLRNQTVDALMTVPGVHINSSPDALPYIINLSVKGIPSQVLINFLSEREIYVSAGSACKKGHRSDVLTKMGINPQLIDSAIRVSLSRNTTPEEMAGFVSAVRQAVGSVGVKL